LEQKETRKRHFRSVDMSYSPGCEKGGKKCIQCEEGIKYMSAVGKLKKKIQSKSCLLPVLYLGRWKSTKRIPYIVQQSTLWTGLGPANWVSRDLRRAKKNFKEKTFPHGQESSPRDRRPKQWKSPTNETDKEEKLLKLSSPGGKIKDSQGVYLHIAVACCSEPLAFQGRKPSSSN